MTGMIAASADRDRESLGEGSRVGRYVIIRDTSGTLHAVSPVSVSAACEMDDGTLLLMPGGRMIAVSQGLVTVLGWLEIRG